MALFDQQAFQSPPPRVEVHRRPPPRDESCIPAEVVDAFLAQGKRITLASVFDGHRAQLSVFARLPLTAEDLTSIARTEIKPAKDGTGGSPAFDPARKLKLEGAFHVNGDGFYQKGDCIIYVQPLDAYEEQLRQATEEWLANDNPDTVRGHLDDLSSSLQFGRVKELDEYPIGHLSSHFGQIEPNK